MNTEELRKEQYALLKVEYKDHDKVVLTSDKGHTYTSKSEELMDFLNDAGAEWEAERGRWMPIETAPKDGTKITVAIIDGNENHYYPTTASYRCYHQNSKGKEMFRDRNGIKLEKLTHWMPITPPKTSKQ